MKNYIFSVSMKTYIFSVSLKFYYNKNDFFYMSGKKKCCNVVNQRCDTKFKIFLKIGFLRKVFFFFFLLLVLIWDIFLKGHSSSQRSTF